MKIPSIITATAFALCALSAQGQTTGAVELPYEWDSTSWQQQWVTGGVGWKANTNLQAFIVQGRPTNWGGGITSASTIAFHEGQEAEVYYEYTSSCGMTISIELVDGSGDTMQTITDELTAESGWGSRVHKIQYSGDAKVRFTATPDISFSSTGMCALRQLSVAVPSPDITAEKILSPSLPTVASGTPLAVKGRFFNRSTIDITDDVTLCYSVNDGETVRETYSGGIAALSQLDYEFTAKYMPSATGDNSIKVWCEYAADTHKDNDSVTGGFSAVESVAFPLVDRFTDGIGGWQSVDTDGDRVTWKAAQVNSNDGVAQHPNYTGAGGDLLVSAPVMMPAGASRASFYYAAINGNGRVSLRLLGGPTPDLTEMHELVSLPAISNAAWLNAYAPIEVEEPAVWYFALELTGANDGMFIDNFFIDRGEDLCMKEVKFDTESGFNKTTSNVSFTFVNHGVSPQNDIRVAYYLNDRDHAVEETVAKTVLPGETYTYVFSIPADISTPESTYTLYGEILTKVGEDSANDLIIGQTLSHWANMTVPYVNIFDEGIDKWKRIYGENSTGVWNNYIWGPFGAYTGSGVLVHAGTGDTPDSWAISECIEMPAGDYDVSFFYRTNQNWDTPEYAQSLELRMGNEPAVEAMTREIVKMEDFTVGRAAWKKHISRIHVDEDGKYYFGFHNFKCADGTNTYIDAFSVIPVEAGAELPWEMDIDAWEEEMTRYNTNRKFVPWTLTETDGVKSLTVEHDEAASRSKVPEGLLATHSMAVEAGREINVEVEYDLSSAYEPLTFCIYASDVDDPDRYQVVAELPRTEGFAKQTVTIPAPAADGEIFIGMRSNQPLEVKQNVPAEPEDVYTLRVKSLRISQAEKPCHEVEGTLPGLFTVSAEGNKVAFSKGNLRYNAAGDEWKFADSQWTVVGRGNERISAAYDGDIDLFGWGTSGYDNTANDPQASNFAPWSSAMRATGDVVNDYNYGPSANMEDADLTGESANYDWGVYNAISNGGNAAGLWRTLSYPEWKYILEERQQAAELAAVATVENVKGLILLPDGWQCPEDVQLTVGINRDFASNSYTADEWTSLEEAGAVLLPFAGYRFSTMLISGNVGRYWTSSHHNGSYAHFLNISATENVPVRLAQEGRHAGHAVRLVHDVADEVQTGITSPSADASGMTVTVGPVSHTVRIAGAAPSSRLTIYTLAGSVILEGIADADGTATLDAGALANGVYILRAGTAGKKILL